MIRLIIAVIGVFVIWALFFSGFDRQRKIIITLSAVVLVMLGLILDSWGKSPRSNIIQVDEVSVCGVTARSTYRTNFNLEVCLKNNADRGTVKRIALVVSVSDCSQGGLCKELQNVTRDFPIDIASGDKLVVEQNLAFDKVSADNSSLQWTVEPVSVKAVRR